jgi:hypothetical protein
MGAAARFSVDNTSATPMLHSFVVVVVVVVVKSAQKPEVAARGKSISVQGAIECTGGPG